MPDKTDLESTETHSFSRMFIQTVARVTIGYKPEKRIDAGVKQESDNFKNRRPRNAHHTRRELQAEGQIESQIGQSHYLSSYFSNFQSLLLEADNSSRTAKMSAGDTSCG